MSLPYMLVQYEDQCRIFSVYKGSDSAEHQDPSSFFCFGGGGGLIIWNKKDLAINIHLISKINPVIWVCHLNALKPWIKQNTRATSDHFRVPQLSGHLMNKVVVAPTFANSLCSKSVCLWIKQHLGVLCQLCFCHYLLAKWKKKHWSELVSRASQHVKVLFNSLVLLPISCKAKYIRICLSWIITL